MILVKEEYHRSDVDNAFAQELENGSLSDPENDHFWDGMKLKKRPPALIDIENDKQIN